MRRVLALVRWPIRTRRRTDTIHHRYGLLLVAIALCATTLPSLAADPPTVVGVSPNTGPTTGGTSVTITGTNLSGATGVYFGSTSATISTVSTTTIVAVAPPQAAGAVNITVTTPAGTSAASSADEFTYLATPTVTGISPNTGPTTGGTSVTITGTNLSGATGVTFGSAAATAVNVLSTTTITAVTPAHAAGAVSIVVTTSAGTATGSNLFTYGATPTSTALKSSKNPAAAGEVVTFTATVTGGSSATGTITFRDGSKSLGTASLAAGSASLSTSSLSVGSHTIVAVFSGDANNAPSQSPPLTQSIDTPVDSLKLRSMQIAATKVVAQNSGSAITGAIDDAIVDGFKDDESPISPGSRGLRLNFTADTSNKGPEPNNTTSEFERSLGFEPANEKGRVREAFAALDADVMARKAAPKIIDPQRWKLWADIRGSGISRPTSSNVASSLDGNQVNVVLGLTRRVSRELLFGVVWGYETFSYNSDNLNSRLKGDGWTIGSYVSWNSTGLRFDLSGAYTALGYDGSAGTAAGNFSGDRWLASTGMTGLIKLGLVHVEPSAKAYALWEHQQAYTDSLGTLQDKRDFFSGRASAGSRFSIPWLVGPQNTVVPYVGVFADYYFNNDNTQPAVIDGAALASTPLLDGWSARVSAGVSSTLANGASLSAGGEFGGIGSDTNIWTVRGRASMPF